MRLERKEEAKINGHYKISDNLVNSLQLMMTKLPIGEFLCRVVEQGLECHIKAQTRSIKVQIEWQKIEQLFAFWQITNELRKNEWYSVRVVSQRTQKSPSLKWKSKQTERGLKRSSCKGRGKSSTSQPKTPNSLISCGSDGNYSVENETVLCMVAAWYLFVCCSNTCAFPSCIK